MRIIEVSFDEGHADTVDALLDGADVVDLQRTPIDEHNRRTLRVLVRAEHAQSLTDRLQTLLGTSEGWRITVLPVEATIPALAPIDRGASGSTREELVADVTRGGVVGVNFVVLTTLSVVLAWIGLTEDNVAVIIGAMVIAPLLGPNLALSVGCALGEVGLIGSALRSNGVGLGLTLVLAAGLGLLFGADLGGSEIVARTSVGPSDVLLALVSGAAAALSLMTGLSSALVGVMVAVALMPPAVVAGLLMGAGRIDPAIGALLLLTINVVCVNLASQVVLIWKGVRPRTGLERRAASTSVRLNLGAWALMLALVALFAFTRVAG